MLCDPGRSYTLHLPFPSLSSSASDKRRSLRIFLIHSSRTVESNRPLIFPHRLRGKPFFSNTLAHASIHSSTSISRRPSIIAIMLTKLDKFPKCIENLPSCARSTDQVEKLARLHNGLPIPLLLILKEEVACLRT